MRKKTNKYALNPAKEWDALVQALMDPRLSEEKKRELEKRLERIGNLVNNNPGLAVCKDAR